MTRWLRVMAVVDVVLGVLLALDAAWVADRLDVSTTPVRIAGIVLAIVGVETYVLVSRRQRRTAAPDAGRARVAA